MSAATLDSAVISAVNCRQSSWLLPIGPVELFTSRRLSRLIRQRVALAPRRGLRPGSLGGGSWSGSMLGIERLLRDG